LISWGWSRGTSIYRRDYIVGWSWSLVYCGRSRRLIDRSRGFINWSFVSRSWSLINWSWSFVSGSWSLINWSWSWGFVSGSWGRSFVNWSWGLVDWSRSWGFVDWGWSFVRWSGISSYWFGILGFTDVLDIGSVSVCVSLVRNGLCAAIG
jgi:hypothetical protein